MLVIKFILSLPTFANVILRNIYLFLIVSVMYLRAHRTYLQLSLWYRNPCMPKYDVINFSGMAINMRRARPLNAKATLIRSLLI